MPSVSAAQHRAMEAAAHGHSTLGIPRDVGKEFVAADASAPQAAGVLFVALDGRVLLMHRAPDEKNFGGHWGLPGGKAEDGETPDQAARRETEEETGYRHEGPLKTVARVKTPTGMIFTTFAAPTNEKFAPAMKDGEHTGFTWADPQHLPAPLHPQVAKLLGENVGVAADMTSEDWASLRTNLVKWTREEEREPAHASDMALDRASVRTYDRDGRLHVATTNISKAAINEYLGREIPDWEQLGLTADKRYKLLRDPDELEKAAPTFNNIPLLSRHVPVTADDHQPNLVIGSLGTDAAFAAPYLQNSLIIWARDGIEAVESEVQKELSSAYRYRADMTPGSYGGEAYDGVMRDIVGNHVALVKDGRAGSDVVVGDQAIPKIQEKFQMSKVLLTRKGSVALGALMIALKPKLAQDAKIDLAPALVGLTHKNFKSKKPAIITAIKDLTNGKLAQDASIDDVIELVDALEKVESVEGADTDPNSGLPIVPNPDDTSMDAGNEQLKAFLTGKLSEEDIAKACALASPAGAADDDETEEDKKKREAEEAQRAQDDTDKTKDMVTKPAMDAAIKAAVKSANETAAKTQREIRDAERAVRPYVGDLAMAHDSAASVYRTALSSLGVKDIEKIDASAYPALLAAQPIPGAGKKVPAVAMDAAAAKGFAERFPGTDRIKTV